MKKIIVIFATIWLLYWGYSKSVANFSCANITPTHWITVKNVPQHSSQELSAVREILSQDFRYLGRGCEFFVFESKDKKYVLKFLKCQRMNVSSFYEYFPFFADKIKHKQKRLKKALVSMALAYDPLFAQTGTLFVQNQPSTQIQQEVTLIDRLGISHKIDLSKVPFALQEKGTEMMAELKALHAKGDKDTLKARLDQLIALIQERSKTDILNPDHSLVLHGNVGFTQERAIYLDIGGFTYRPKADKRKYLKKELDQLKPVLLWLKSHDKELADYFRNTLRNIS
jgi:hypothetical protein